MLVLNGSLFCNVILVSHRLSLGEPICIVCWHFLQPRACAHSALSGSSWADTPSYRNVLYPRGAVQLLETMAIALDRRLVRLCSIFRRIWIARLSGKELFRGDFAVQTDRMFSKHWTRHSKNTTSSWLCRRYGTVTTHTSHWRSLMH